MPPHPVILDVALQMPPGVTSVKRGHEYITVVHDLNTKRLLFACPGRDHETVEAFATDLVAHDGDPDAVAHVCMHMSAAYTKGVGKSLRQAAISFDLFHVVALSVEAMDAVRREECAASNDEEKAATALRAWLSWARRCRLEPFKRLAKTLAERFEGVVRGMLDGRSNAYVEAMNGLLQQTKAAARGFRTVENFIAIAYLRMSKLKHLPAHPMMRAIPLSIGHTCHAC